MGTCENFHLGRRRRLSRERRATPIYTLHRGEPLFRGVAGHCRRSSARVQNRWMLPLVLPDTTSDGLRTPQMRPLCQTVGLNRQLCQRDKLIKVRTC